ncbi:MAG: glycoside hydrolase family 9 protein [Phycisphaerales bacterium]
MKPLKWLCVIVLLSFFLLPAVRAQENIAINFFDVANSNLGTFSCWDTNAKSYVYLGGSATFTRCNNCVPVDMSQGAGSLVFQSTLPSGWWNVQFKYDWGHSQNFLRYGSSPYLYMRVKWGAIASGAGMTITLTDDTSIWNLYSTYGGSSGSYSNQSASVNFLSYVTPSTTTWQDVYIPMSAFLANNPNLDLTRIGLVTFYGSGTYSATNTLYIEKFKIVPAASNPYSDMVKVNQIGYLPSGRKLAIVSYESGAVLTPPTYFQVRDYYTNNTVHTGSLVSDTVCYQDWDGTGDIVYHADFTSYTTAGTYYIYLPEVSQSSQPFDISNNAFNNVFRDALRFYYHARSAEAIVEPYAEGYTRGAIYTNNSACIYDYDDDDPGHMYDYDPTNIGITTRNVSGGWFDAGDLHLDTHNNIGTLWFLLETLEQFQSKVVPNGLNLPESDGTTNDLLLLIKKQLDWFIKMQNTDGSVHFIVVEEGDLSHQHISDVSSGAACILAGIFAKAYPLFYSAGMTTYANDLLSKAQLSWTWLQNHPDTFDPNNPSGGKYAYHIPDDRMFRAFAAIELYIATGTMSYRTYFDNAFNAEGGDPLSAWGDNQAWGGILGTIIGPEINMGYMDYIETTRAVDATIEASLQDAFITQADWVVGNDDCTTYNIPMLAPNSLYWGSSGTLCGNGYVLLRAYAWTGDPNYYNAAMDVLDWVCGRNPVCRNFITGYSDYLHGTDIYSFYWFDHEYPLPGYLCGNINCLGYGGGNFLDFYIKYPWKYYMNLQNAALLEPCIHWQAEFCYLLGQFAATPNPPAPNFVAAGTVTSGTGTITPALPSGIATNDILVLFVETANQAVSISNQNGGTWTQVTNSPQGTGTAGGTAAARLTAFWSRYNGTQGAPTVSDSGNHQLGRMIAVRGATTSGTPFDITAGGVESTADTTGSIPGATTTVTNTLVVTAIATSLPDSSSTTRFSAWTNANLASLTERTDNSVTAGNGGGLGIATGVKATAGAYGNTAVTLATSASKGMMSIAIKP